VPGVFDECDPEKTRPLTRANDDDTDSCGIRGESVARVVLAERGCPIAGHDPAPTLQDLRGLSEFRARFESDRDKARIVLLLSPT